MQGRILLGPSRPQTQISKVLTALDDGSSLDPSITSLELPAVLGAPGGQSQPRPPTAGAHHQVQQGSSITAATGKKRVRTADFLFLTTPKTAESPLPPSSSISPRGCCGGNAAGWRIHLQRASRHSGAGGILCCQRRLRFI